MVRGLGPGCRASRNCQRAGVQYKSRLVLVNSTPSGYRSSCRVWWSARPANWDGHLFPYLRVQRLDELAEVRLRHALSLPWLDGL